MLIENISSVVAASEKDVTEIIKPSEIQVEVLNGSGVSGIADKFTEFLRTKNYDVVNVGNYRSFNVDNTIIIDRTGDMSKALAVAKTLGIKQRQVIRQVNKNYFLDVSIIIGKDINQISMN